jgi:hypothetical protein
MSIETALTALLKADTFLTALVAGRIYPLYRPQGETGACVIYQEISGPDTMSIDGDLGLIEGRFQITCWAATHAECVALRDTLSALLRSVALGVVSAGVTIQAVQILDRGDVPALDEQAEAASRYGKFLDVQISYEE